MYTHNDIMYPPRVTPLLRDAGGPGWRRLVDRVVRLEETEPEALAFNLTMVRLDGCLECETDSYRAMRGCEACAQQTVRRYRNDEKTLLKLYDAALKDTRAYLELNPPKYK
jgi:hypothetical protein